MKEPQKLFDSALVAPQTAATNVTTTANLDTLGADYAIIRIHFAAEANTNATGPKTSLLSSDDTVVTNFATVVADQVAIDITAQSLVRYDVDLKGRKRYLRLAVTGGTNGTNDNITFAANASLWKDAHPAALSELANVHVSVI